jgi:hypothetical protein
VLAAILAALIFAGVDYGSWKAGTSPIGQSVAAFVPRGPLYLEVALATFNSVAICCLGVIFYAHEKSTAAQFGAVVRNNISTIILALLIAFIRSIIEVVTMFFAI